MIVINERTGRRSERPATLSVLDPKNGPPFAMINTNRVVIARHPVTSSVMFSHHAPSMIVRITEVIRRTVRIVLSPGDGFLPEIRRESVKRREKKAEQSKTKLRSIRFLKRALFDS